MANEVNRIAELLLATWKQADPKSSVALHPVSYVATFADMAKAIIEDRNTRPAAPVEGLETVGYVTTSPTGAEVFQRKPLVPGHGQFGYKQDAVVTRSQADELLAAERAETMRQVKHWSELYKQQHYRAEKAEAIIAAERAEKEKWKVRGDQHWDTFRSIREMAREGDCERIILWVNDAGSGYTEPLEATVKSLTDKAVALEADNAALTARVKELSKHVEELQEKNNAETCACSYDAVGDVCKGHSPTVKALETQLAAARKALEPFALISSEGLISAGSGHVTMTTCAEYFHKARAALGVKP
ncbi:hypothetical protein WYI_13797 [Ochrobactrum sp. CDB2]|nr:hypothetical protein WYI_13797 [Ochrobactrum sp. CDB2]